MPTLYIDNNAHEIPQGKNLLETCLTLGFDVPYFCWHPAMGSVGACRQCAVKVFKNEDDKTGRIVMSCMEPALNNQRISIVDPEAKEFREQVIEWLMTNHPHDCAVCDEGGSCHLQDMTVMTGHNTRRFRFKKRTYTNQYLGPFVNHEMNRCIQCYRCVRFYKDYAGGKDLDAFASKNNVYFGRAEDGVLESEFSGNLAEVCPTGVFTDKTLKEHYTRKWDLTMAPSICQHCSLGCNTTAGERYGSLRMIANRYHGEVNGYFLCDRGRFGYEFVNANDRIRRPHIDNAMTGRTEIINHMVSLLKKPGVIGIGSPRASLQSNFALKELVSSKNFYQGISDIEYDLANLALKILSEGPVLTPSTREVEEADAVLIMGEDITNTAPILALSVRQAVNRQPAAAAAKDNIPLWNNAAVRGVVQEKKGPLFIFSLHATKLDELATATYRATADDIARLGFAIANLLDGASPQVEKLPIALRQLAEQIAITLGAAKKPVIISGTGCENESVMRSAANIAWALNKKNNSAGLIYTLPSCNSMGLAMMGGQRLSAAFDAVRNGHAHTVIVMENDLYRQGTTSDIDRFLKGCMRVIALDHSSNATTAKANVLIPAGTFAESDGILVNNESRAQRFFQVYESPTEVRESWRWLMDIGTSAGNERMSAWKNFEDVTNAIAREETLLKGITEITPPSSFRLAGQRIPRQPHRYSGRTSMNAQQQVSEPKPPEDPDSALSYTMEGYRGMPPPSMIPFVWSPGWNSVQSLNKYQESLGKALRGGDPGVRLIAPATSKSATYFQGVPEAFRPMEDHLWIVPIHHIFGSEELSARSPSVAQRIPAPYILLHTQDAADLKLRDGENFIFHIHGETYSLPVKISTSMVSGAAAVPYGIGSIPYAVLPEWAIIKGYVPEPIYKSTQLNT